MPLTRQLLDRLSCHCYLSEGHPEQILAMNQDDCRYGTGRKEGQRVTSGAGRLAHLGAFTQVAHARELLLVGCHEQLDGALPDLQGGHMRQEVIAHKEAHEYCKRHRMFIPGPTLPDQSAVQGSPGAPHEMPVGQFLQHAVAMASNCGVYSQLQNLTRGKVPGSLGFMAMHRIVKMGMMDAEWFVERIDKISADLCRPSSQSSRMSHMSRFRVTDPQRQILWS